ncbi:MAG: acetyl-CoA carboxylase biotin carboxyl carrier protein [Planctomycetota bacterium]
MDLNEVERLMQLMKEHDLVEIELEDPEQGSRIRMKKACPPEVNHHPVLAPTLAVPAVAPAPAPGAVAVPAPAAEAPAAEEEDRSNLIEVPSPMVGSFYRASSPDTDPFVEVGDRIDEESVVCIIEAMKVMNEIKAEVSGEVVEILVQNGEAVEFGQPLFLLRTDS